MKKQTNKPKEERSLRATIWLHFAGFTIVILLLIWFFQVFSIDAYYEYSNRRKIREAAADIVSEFNAEKPRTISRLVEELAYKNTMSIAVTDWYGNVITRADYSGGYSIVTAEQGLRLFEYRNSLAKSTGGYILDTITNERFGTVEIIYGQIIGYTNYILFINAPLEPIGPTVDIIMEMFFYIFPLVLVAALWVSLLLSKRISSPFTHIIRSANKLASGDYSTHFERGSYTEINRLSDTLNYAASEISKVDNLRNDLIANVSHDLRTPLTMIKAYAEMIRDLSGDNPAKRNEHLGVIIDETDRLSALVSSMLELSKLQSKTIDVNVSDFSLNEFINSVLQRYRLLSEQTGFEFVYESDGDVICHGDEQKLEQVMFNFINNAVNYSGDSKKIIVRTTTYPKTVKVEVVDFGTGISKEKLPMIFDRYYRDERTKRDVVGTGLGLSIVKEILKLHNTRFGVQSELGKGSTFWFEISRAQEK